MVVVMDSSTIYPWDVVLDSTGNVYVAVSEAHHIRAFTEEGKFLRRFGKKGSGDRELDWPSSVSIDSDDIHVVLSPATIVFPCSPVKVSS